MEPAAHEEYRVGEPAGAGVLAVDDRAGALAEHQDSVLAWCLREAVTNVVKHSGATRCDVSVTRDDGHGTSIEILKED